MAENNTLDKLIEIIEDKLGVDKTKITINARFIEDLGADSLDTVELIMQFEEEFDIEIPDEDIQLGKALVIEKGQDVTILTIGSQLSTAIESLPELKKIGISAEVIYTPTIKPFDYHTVAKSISKTNKYLVIEEHSQYGGVGDEVMRATKELTNVKSSFLNIPNKYIHGYGSYNDHCKYLGLTKENVIKVVKKLVTN